MGDRNLRAAAKDVLDTILVEIPETGLSAGKLTLWYCDRGKRMMGLCIEGNSFEAASLNAIGGALRQLKDALCKPRSTT